MAFFADADVTFHLQKGSSHFFFAPGSLRRGVLNRPDPSSSELWEGAAGREQGIGGGRASVSGAGGGEGWEGVDGGEC